MTEERTGKKSLSDKLFNVVGGFFLVTGLSIVTHISSGEAMKFNMNVQERKAIERIANKYNIKDWETVNFRPKEEFKKIYSEIELAVKESFSPTNRALWKVNRYSIHGTYGGLLGSLAFMAAAGLTSYKRRNEDD